MKLILIRHGETEENVKGAQGQKLLEKFLIDNNYRLVVDSENYNIWYP